MLELIFAFLRKRLQIVKKIIKGVSWVPHVSLDDRTVLMIWFLGLTIGKLRGAVNLVNLAYLTVS